MINFSVLQIFVEFDNIWKASDAQKHTNYMYICRVELVCVLAANCTCISLFVGLQPGCRRGKRERLEIMRKYCLYFVHLTL